MRIAFLGTPDFAIPSLQMLIQTGYELIVFTQPDRPAGRHAVHIPPPVKVFAHKHGIPVYQPEHIRSDDGLAALKRFSPDLMVTAAFGQMLSMDNLAIPRFGCINVHGSLLPKYRGAAPIQWAIICGENESGITTMFTDIGVDTGDMLLQDVLAIRPDETAGELSKRLAQLGAETLYRTLKALHNNALICYPQTSAQASTYPILKKEHGRLEFSQPAMAVHNRVRGTNPWPGAFALLDDEPLKIWRTRPHDTPHSYSDGYCFGSAKEGLFIACKAGAVEVLELQSPGGKRLDGRSFLLGKPICGKKLA